MTAKATRAETRVVYFAQTHNRPEQLARLVGVITEASPAATVLISHDEAGTPLDVAALESLGNVHVVLEPGGYGDFSHMDRFLAGIDWLDAHGVEYDWLENLTGADYPAKPVAEIEEFLAASPYDGHLLYSPVFPERVPASADQGAADWYRLVDPRNAAIRYDYRHLRFGMPSPAKQSWMRPLMLLNYVQPLIKFSNSFASVGIRQRTVFGPQFHCYGGSFFCSLRAECARYVRDYAKANPRVVDYFRTTLASDEVFIHSVLVNSGRFRLSTDYKRYIDWNGGSHTHPKTLGAEDLDRIVASGAHWARKLDMQADARLFDLLDERVRPAGLAGLPGTARGR